MTSLLSPLAAPFAFGQPQGLNVIHCNGIPSAVFFDDHRSSRRSSSIGGLSDEAIDECFPPTDEDLAELEVMDQYLEMLAFLESVETQEENKRTFALHRKRFEARRQDGLTGKPHQVSESRVLESRKKQFKGTELEKFHLWASTKGTHDNHVAPRSPPHHHKTSKQAYRNLHQPKGSRS
ncbi:hypothetical protein ScalyP_jg6361 [Parmales sp. scaly parma]|nr:hypothetical protein ScalyP_jg6361 [Parmales sp. scaly parma]